MSSHDHSDQPSKPSEEERQAFLDGLVRDRGYVLDYHKVMTKYSLQTIRATNAVADAVYLQPRRLERGVKELLYVATLSVLRAPKEHIVSHIRVGLGTGLSAEEILEALEIIIPAAGIVAFEVGLDAWIDATDAKGLEPSSGPGTPDIP